MIFRRILSYSSQFIRWHSIIQREISCWLGVYQEMSKRAQAKVKNIKKLKNPHWAPFEFLSVKF